MNRSKFSLAALILGSLFVAGCETPPPADPGQLGQAIADPWQYKAVRYGDDVVILVAGRHDGKMAITLQSVDLKADVPVYAIYEYPDKATGDVRASMNTTTFKLHRIISSRTPVQKVVIRDMAGDHEIPVEDGFAPISKNAE